MLAKTEWEDMPADVWRQRALAWALYYMIKSDVEAGDYASLIDAYGRVEVIGPAH